MGLNSLQASVVFGLAFMAASTTEAVPLYPELVGVNVAGGEFGSKNIPGTIFRDYIYPDRRTLDYLADAGMTTIRMPFLWERLQRNLGGDVDATELSRIDASVNYANSLGLNVILDPHNFGKYGGQKIGSAAVPDAVFDDFWAQLATHYQGNDKVIFGLMNEPNAIPATTWAHSAQSAVNAIRATGADNLILVPGTAFTGAHNWVKQNAAAFATFDDPFDNMAFEVHQYLDTGFAGTSGDCISTTIGADSLRGFTNWLHQTDSRGFLAEFAGGANPTCLSALDNMLAEVTENGDVWLGWTYWAAGAFWNPTYPFSVQPTPGGGDKPQMAVLKKYAAFAHAIPEPGSLAILGVGLLGMGAATFRRRKRRA
jgi:endoglucanase